MPFARITDPETSHEAARSVTNVTPLKTEILKALTSPMTDPELLIQISYRSSLVVTASGVRSRRAELVQAGLVKDTGARRKLSTGRSAIVWGLA